MKSSELFDKASKIIQMKIDSITLSNQAIVDAQTLKQEVESNKNYYLEFMEAKDLNEVLTGLNHVITKGSL